MALVINEQVTEQENPLGEHDEGLFEEEEDAGEFLRRASTVQRIESSFESYRAKASSLVKEQDSNLIDQDVFKEVVVMQRKRFWGCLSLPFTFLFFLLFAQSTFLHEDITNVFVLEKGLKGKISDGASNVENIAQMWNWLNTHLVPTLFNQEDNLGNRLTDKKMWSRVLEFNQLTGPMVLEQLRGDKELCTKGEGVFGDMTCYPMNTRNKEEFGRNVAVTIPVPNASDYAGGLPTYEERKTYWESAFKARTKRRLREARPEYKAILPGGLPSDGDGFAAYIFPNSRIDLVKAHMQFLFDKQWLDPQTKQLKVKALLFNAEVGRPRLEQVSIRFMFSRAGGIFYRIDLETLFLRFWSDMISMGVDALYICGLLFLTIVQVRSLIRDWRNREVKKKCKTFWSVLQWSIVVSGWMCLLMFQAQRTLMIGIMPYYHGLIDSWKQDLPAETNELGASMHDRVDWLTYMNTWFRIFMAMYLLLLMIRFFVAFQEQPRLGVVTTTLEVSLIDVVHFLVVVLPTFMAYAISGCFIFGRRIEDFSTFESAVGICFKIFMETEYDWPDLSAEYWWTAAFWTWSFMFLLVMLMLNMVLAIVLDVYTEIRKKSGQSETVWVTFVHMVQQVRHHSKWISNAELLDKVPTMNKMISRADLLRTFPGMCQSQLNMLITACKYQSEVSEHGTKENENDAKKLAMSVKLVMDKIEETTHMLHEGTFDTCGNALYRSWLYDIAKEMAYQNHTMLALQWQLQQLEWQWHGIEAFHGSGASFRGKHDLPSSKVESL